MTGECLRGDLRLHLHLPALRIAGDFYVLCMLRHPASLSNLSHVVTLKLRICRRRIRVHTLFERIHIGRAQLRFDSGGVIGGAGRCLPRFPRGLRVACHRGRGRLCPVVLLAPEIQGADREEDDNDSRTHRGAHAVSFAVRTRRSLRVHVGVLVHSSSYRKVLNKNTQFAFTVAVVVADAPAPAFASAASSCAALRSAACAAFALAVAFSIAARIRALSDSTSLVSVTEPMTPKNASASAFASAVREIAVESVASTAAVSSPH